MAVGTDAEREAAMKGRIEDKLPSAANVPGAPAIEIIDCFHELGDPFMAVKVCGFRRLLEVSQHFLEDEPDEEDLRRIPVAVKYLLESDAPGIRLDHYGVW